MEAPISATSTLIDLFGAVALLLWGLRMVRTGMGRAFGGELRHWIGVVTRNRFSAFAAGAGVTVLLQSSTATSLMTASFAGRGLMAAGMALAVMLGADLGTSLVARVLVLDVHWLSPLAVLCGVALFMTGEGGKRRAIGRAIIGLGLMLLALRLIGTATVPIREAEAAQMLLAGLAGEPLPAALAAALLTALAHSSLAVVLLVATLGTSGVIDVPLALAFVLGANLGGILPPLVATFGQPAGARRVPLGNAVMRLAGCILALFLLDPAAEAIALVSSGAGSAAVNFHVAFNAALAILFLPLVNPVAALVRRLLPEVEAADDPARPRHLDRSVLEEPSRAIACAVRETLRLGDVIESMLRQSLDVLQTNDQKLMAQVVKADDVVDRLSDAIKLYLARLDDAQLDADETARMTEVMAFAIDLEHIGDIIDRNLMELAAKKAKHRLRLSDEDFADLHNLHRQVTANLHLALNAFIADDPRLARQLLEAKTAARRVALDATDAHLERVRRGRTDSIGGSSLHLDILRDLRRINSHIAAVAYAIIRHHRAGGDQPVAETTETLKTPREA